MASDEIILEFKAEMASLRKELNKLKASLGQVDKKADETTDGIKNIDKQSTQLSSSFKKLGQAIAGAFAAERIISFTKEAIQLAGAAEGVQIAFDRLNQPDLLNDLRVAVNGTVDDLELMKQAVRANNFNIPLNQLASLFEFATRRAKETGESVDFLVNSIVLGIGRKSPLILDNLGISAVRLKDELKGVGVESAAIGDIAKIVGDIAEEEMQKMGENVTTAGDAFMQMNAAAENTKLALGQLALEGVGSLVDAFNELGILELTQDTDKLKQTIKDITAVVVGAAAAYTTYKSVLAITNALNKANITSTAAYNLLLIATKDITAAAAIAQQGLNKAIMSNPFGIAVGAISVLVGSIASFVIANKDGESAVNDMSGTVADNIEELKELKEVYDALGISQQDVNDRLIDFEETLKKIDLERRINQQKEILASLWGQIEAEEKVSASLGTVRQRLIDLQNVEELAKNELSELIDEYNSFLKSLGFGEDEIQQQTVAMEKFGKAIMNASKVSGDLEAGLRRIGGEALRSKGSVDIFAAAVRKGLQQAMGVVDKYNESIGALETGQFGFNEDQKNQAIEIAAQTYDAIGGIVSAAGQHRQQELKEQLDAGLISEQQYASELAAIKRRQARADKANALFNIAINTAQAITAAVSTVGGAVLVPFITALGAAQAAAVLAQPIPKFAKGGEVGGKLHSNGGTLIEAERGEYVINRSAYAANKEAVEAINANRFQSYILAEVQKAAVKDRMGVAYDDTNLIHAVRRNGKVDVRNASEVGRAFANELARKKYFDA